MSKILFLLKSRDEPYSQYTNEQSFSEDNENGKKIYCLSSGLYNSAKMIVEMLNFNGVESHLVDVIDNNSIDREVTKYRPTHVIIEALWVVPEKFDELKRLHPTVKWIIRLHSEVPFIANEGIAMNWIKRYISMKNVYVACNSLRMIQDIERISSYMQKKNLIFLPNYYPTTPGFRRTKAREYKTLNICCFGALRPMKNQLSQAFAAIQLAKELGVNLNFHINSNRVENNGDNVLKNLKALFDSMESTKYRLIEHSWRKHHKFIELMDRMDLGMQVSMSETFNIVTADLVDQNVPVVVSHEINWVPKRFRADPTSISDIVKKMKRALFCERIGGTYLNKKSLIKFSKNSKQDWLKEFKNGS